MGKYRTIVMDPPWPVNHTLYGKTYNLPHYPTLKALPYETMTRAALLEFPINDFAAKTGLLFLWVTSGRLEDGGTVLELAFELVAKWGFRYRAMLYWDKQGDGIPKPWTPYRTTIEPILFCTRGISHVPPYGRYADIFRAPQTSHSRKPAKFYELLREWTPDPRVDIFAREIHEGFEGWGAEYIGRSALPEFIKPTPAPAEKEASN